MSFSHFLNFDLKFETQTPIESPYMTTKFHQKRQPTTRLAVHQKWRFVFLPTLDAGWAKKTKSVGCCFWWNLVGIYGVLNFKSKFQQMLEWHLIVFWLQKLLIFYWNFKFLTTYKNKQANKIKMHKCQTKGHTFV